MTIFNFKKTPEESNELHLVEFQVNLLSYLASTDQYCSDFASLCGRNYLPNSHSLILAFADVMFEKGI